MQLCENLLFFCAIHGTLLDRRCKADRGRERKKGDRSGRGKGGVDDRSNFASAGVLKKRTLSASDLLSSTNGERKGIK